jgi:hypothetical protein
LAIALGLLACGAARAAGAACVGDAESLCLQGGRFRVTSVWRDFQGNTGVGQASPLTADTGALWFFAPDNLELMVKVLDGRPLNNHFWVFLGALSSVEYTLTVTDTATGNSKSYTNPSGRLASVADTSALPGGPASLDAGAAAFARRASSRAAPVVSLVATAPAVAAGCAPSSTELCLGDARFRLTVRWKDFAGRVGDGQAVALTRDTGYFWFFGADNVELVVKVLDGRVLNGNFWVFFGALSTVEYDLVVTDTVTGLRRTYHNGSGQLASRADVDALADRPLVGYGFTPRYFASVDVDWTADANVRPFFADLDRRHLGVWALTRPWYQVGADGKALIADYDALIGDYPRLGKRIVAALQIAQLDSGLPDVAPGWQPTWEDWNAHDGWTLFADAARRLAGRYHPPFLAIGVEINGFARRFPAEYARFATLHFPAIAAAVRGVSPDTIVFPLFQFEQLIGDLHGFVDPDGNPNCAGCVPFDQINSLSGITYAPMPEVLDQFPPEALTHVGLTTYPHYNRDFATPAQIPDDYFSRLYGALDAAHQGVRLVFPETAWPANAELDPGQACMVCARQHPDAHPVCYPEVIYDSACDAAELDSIAGFLSDWLGGEAEQVAWVDRFDDLARPLGSPLTLWLLAHDADPRNEVTLAGLYAHAGLRSHDGSVARPAFSELLLRWAGQSP